ncbi:DUF4251 domain-containing protein [Altibacter sp. HG106]|uniref:DUF4251 domain-containing protein n=1 Tax=Altibacter sp. HG106 TaxID=3023937 RepID=UPI0023504C9F|nr:DUF4251 domain-containing protein [Altibacter sp. HG106]MDC7993537.1 DUF4251 domain-containing protein [Altibacter sp. HG106]
MKKKSLYRRLFLIAVMVIVFQSCGSSESANEEAQNAQAFQAISELVASEMYRIDVESVQPFNTATTTAVLNDLAPYMNGSTTGNIQVGGDNYFLEVRQGKVVANMPFFGQQLQGSGGNRNAQDVGVDMEGRTETYSVNERNEHIEMYFEADDSNSRTERYQVFIRAYPNNRAMIQVTSSQRTVIRYMGRIHAIPDAM